MKALKYVVAVCLLVFLPAARADEVKPGDTYDQVIAALGDPLGSLVSGDYCELHYDRGHVELRSNRVVRAKLVSAEEAARLRAERERLEAEVRKQVEVDRVRRIAEGTAVRKAKLADTAFMSLPAADRVHFWQTFRWQYPEVALGDEYTSALHDYELQQSAQRASDESRQKIAELEQRVAQAEEKARDAEERSRKHDLYPYYDNYPPSYYVPGQIVPGYGYGYAPSRYRQYYYPYSAGHSGLDVRVQNGKFDMKIGLGGRPGWDNSAPRWQPPRLAPSPMAGP